MSKTCQTATSRTSEYQGFLLILTRMCGELYFSHNTYSGEENHLAGLCVFYIEYSELVFHVFSLLDDNPQPLSGCFVLLRGSYQGTYSQVGAWWPTYSINPTLHYSVSMCLTFHIYPLTSSGRIMTCRRLNLKVCRLSGGPHSKTCVPFLVYRTIRRHTNICYTRVTCSICFVSFLILTGEKCWFFPISQITFILSELHATDGGFKLVIGLSPGYGAWPPHPRHSHYSIALPRPCCWRL